MKFQFHITINDLVETNKNSFLILCKKNNVKPVLISLDKGKYIRQPMFTKVVENESFEQAFEEIEKVCKIFKENNFKILRIKSEVPPENSENFKEKNSKFYFEWHCKVSFEKKNLIEKLCYENNAHISKNSLEDEECTRFVTIREYNDKTIFYSNTKKLSDLFIENGIKIIKQKFEYCIYDNKIELDSGWA